MKIAIASGKGGTGKTTITASLASIWGKDLIVADLDVEEPNLHLFLNPTILESKKAVIEVPIINHEKCNTCEKCINFCKFNALSLINKSVMVFPEMCHGCGGCFLVCNNDAIESTERELGEILTGTIGDINFIMGQLRIGEAMSPPLMREIKKEINKQDVRKKDILIDAPPGTSCPAINAVIDSDFILLVTEPTPFGLHDLILTIEAFNNLKKTMGVVINRSGIGNTDVYDYCNKNNLPILTEIPFDIRIAHTYSEGGLIANISEEYKKIFIDLKEDILKYA